MNTNTYGDLATRSIQGSAGIGRFTTWRRTQLTLLAVLSAVVMASNSAEAVTIKKLTKFENLSATPVVARKGNIVTLNGQLTYRDKKLNWGYLGYTSVPVTVWVFGQPRAATMTDRSNGFVTFRLTASYPNHIPAYGATVPWTLVFDGNSELYRASRTGYFRITN